MSRLARTSKRISRVKITAPEAARVEKIYDTGIYGRLSVESNSEKDESVENQIMIGKSYISEHSDLKLVNCYTDIGKSGTQFNRPGFENMMRDIREGKINCVIVKDFSRFGRNYIETGNYIEKIFPFLGVRFISVSDQYDSLAPADQNQSFSMHFKNIANELYAKDVAAKVSVAKKIKIENREFLGSLPPYGYRVEKIDGRRSLVTEALSSDVVKKIYEMYDGGSTLVGIVKWLYEKKIHTPGGLKKYKRVYWKEGDKLSQWERGTVVFTLSNQNYLGNLIHFSKNASEPIIMEDTHEALVDEDVFFRIQSRLKENVDLQRKRKEMKQEIEDDFADLLYCGECNRKLMRVVQIKRRNNTNQYTNIYYHCPYYRKMDESKCEAESITLIRLRKLVFVSLQKEFALSDVRIEDLISYNLSEKELHKERFIKALETIQIELNHYVERASQLYLEYRKGKDTLETYQKKKELLEREKEENERNRNVIQRKLKDIDQKVKTQNDFLKAACKCQKISDLNSELLHLLVKKISIYAGKRVEIIWNYNNNWINELGEQDEN